MVFVAHHGINNLITIIPRKITSTVQLSKREIQNSRNPVYYYLFKMHNKQLYLNFRKAAN